MKIAVIGGGTAGYMAAAQISKHFPEFDLYHIYDPNMPAIGVGEGTTLAFPDWLHSITGLSYQELVEKCYLTRKYGIRFENWGVNYEQFMHHFYPVSQAYAYHISAAKMVELLHEYVTATKIHKKVIDVVSNGIAVNITFADDTELEADLVLDARGFPKNLTEEHIQLSLIPTNAALICQGPVVEDGMINIQIQEQVLEYQSATRSIARPHGWIFTIPLTYRTSYGYIYNNSLSSLEEVEADFKQFLDSEGIEPFGEAKKLTFPNFTQATFFDGALLKIGNAASFLEPLEATAIAVIIKQLKLLCYWPLKKFAKQNKREKLSDNNLQVFNNHLCNYLHQVALFVSWHYAMGSCFNTPFWQFAKSNFTTEVNKLDNQKVLGEFEQYLDNGSRLAHPIKKHKEFCQTAPALINSYGQFPASSFAEVGYGIGYF